MYRVKRLNRRSKWSAAGYDASSMVLLVACSYFCPVSLYHDRESSTLPRWRYSTVLLALLYYHGYMSPSLPAKAAPIDAEMLQKARREELWYHSQCQLAPILLKHRPEQSEPAAVIPTNCPRRIKTRAAVPTVVARHTDMPCAGTVPKYQLIWDDLIQNLKQTNLEC